MKRIIIIGFVLLASFLNGYAQCTSDPVPARKSAKASNPVQVSLDQTSIRITFLQEITDITVALIHSSGIPAYYSNTAVSGSMIIYTWFLPKSDYTLRIYSNNNIIHESVINLK